MTKLDLLRDKVKHFEVKQKDKFFKDKNPFSLLKVRTDFFNQIIIEQFANMKGVEKLSKKVFLCAVGGFGRKELYPCSDVDTFIVSKNCNDEELHQIVNHVLLPLLDSGVDISYIFKNFDALPSIHEELTTVTSLLSSRYLAGNFYLFEQWKEERFEPFIKTYRKRYFKAKLEEYNTRLEKFKQSPYILEPNIKEGIGGLREFHYIKWLGRVVIGIEQFEYLRFVGLLDKKDEIVLRNAFEFFSMVRCFIHLSHCRKKEILTFDLQEELADFLNYKEKSHFLRVEQFMADYYKHSHEVFMISKKLLHHYELFLKGQSIYIRKEVDTGISIEGTGKGELQIYEKAIERKPRLIFKLFSYSKKLKKPIAYKTIHFIKNLATKVSIYSWDEEMKRLFFDILEPDSLNSFESIMQMYESDFLKMIIPEFGYIYHKMQFDAYHIYTVDLHSLITLKHIWSFFEIDKDNIREKIKKPWLLSLAALFHDIGKGYGKHHDSVGAEIVEQIGTRMNLDAKDLELLVFLVKNHLLFSNIAQHRDITDYKFLRKVFFNEIKSLENLHYLYFLTVADSMSVGDGVWNDWKEHLYQSLLRNFIDISKTIKTEDNFVSEQIKLKKERLKEYLYSLGKENIITLIDILPDSYILSNKVDLMARDLLVDFKLINSGLPFVLEAVFRLKEKFAEIIIATKDVQGLFSQLAGALTLVGFNILSAIINTRKNGNVLDVFTVDLGKREFEEDHHMIEKLNEILEKIIVKGEKIDNLVIEKARRYHRKSIFKEKNEVFFDNINSDEYTIIDIFATDHMGLLFEITRTLNILGLNIFFSRITTYGERAVDVFYVQKNGKKIEQSEMDTVKTAILRAISH